MIAVPTGSLIPRAASSRVSPPSAAFPSAVSTVYIPFTNPPPSGLLLFKASTHSSTTIMSRSVTLEKGKNNMIGISIGGGAPFCPVLYVVQVFHRTPAYQDGSLCPGDELVTVSGVSLRNHSRKQTADMIQSAKGSITISFNRIEPPREKGSDIALKKVKHRMVEKMKDSTADTLGLSRAVLVNDKLVKKVQYLENNARVYKGIAEKARGMLGSMKSVVDAHKELGSVFANIGVYEPQQTASAAFMNFGLAHRTMGEEGDKLVAKVGPMLKDLNTYLQKAVPDTKLTLKKYSDAKFEFLAYCLKVKEMDDEEYEAATYGQPLGRVLAGNYEYRMFLRCRHAAKLRFIRLRSDVLVKLQLLDNKRVQDVAFQLERLVGSMYVYNRQCYKIFKPAAVFPIEVHLSVESVQSTVTSSTREEEEEGERERRREEEEGERREEGQNELDLVEDLLIQTD